MSFKVIWDPKDDFGILGVMSKDGKTMFEDLPSIVQDAVEVATEAHRGQQRKDYITPYIVHPWCVLKICIDCEWHFTDEELAAFVLHDVVEDTKWPRKGENLDENLLRAKQFQELVDLFGVETTSIVWLLTKPVGAECRRLIYRTSLRRVAPSVIAGKLADALHNLMDLPPYLVKEEHECDHCDGKGFYLNGSDEANCVQCKGDGVIRIMFADFFKEKVRQDVLPLIPILRMHGTSWHKVANWFETRIMRFL